MSQFSGGLLSQKGQVDWYSMEHSYHVSAVLVRKKIFEWTRGSGIAIRPLAIILILLVRRWWLRLYFCSEEHLCKLYLRIELRFLGCEIHYSRSRVLTYITFYLYVTVCTVRAGTPSGDATVGGLLRELVCCNQVRVDILRL